MMALFIVMKEKLSKKKAIIPLFKSIKSKINKDKLHTDKLNKSR